MKNLFKLFIDGVLFFFSGGENPIEKHLRKRQNTTDLDNMKKDWYNVGNDIRRAYEKYKPC